MKRAARRGVTLVELIIVIGIIMILIGLLAPAIASARRTAQAVKCRAQLHQIGQAIVQYANDNNGDVIPWRMTRRLTETPWGEILFGETEVARSIVRCPIAEEREWQSYLLNRFLELRQIRYDGRNRVGIPASEIVLAGENRPWMNYLYVLTGISNPPRDPEMDYDPYRHGRTLRSNYLWLDMHVSNEIPTWRPGAMARWDVPWTMPSQRSLDIGVIAAR